MGGDGKAGKSARLVQHRKAKSEIKRNSQPVRKTVFGVVLARELVRAARKLAVRLPAAPRSGDMPAAQILLSLQGQDAAGDLFGWRRRRGAAFRQ